MPDATLLDLAHAAMHEAPDDDRARLAFHERIAEAELCVLLEGDGPQGPRPRVFRLEEGPFVLAFDREDRLAAFTEAPADFAAMPGRLLVADLAARGFGLGLNLGVAPSEYLMAPEGVRWLAAVLATQPAPVTLRPKALHPPGALPDALFAALDRRLARMAGLAREAILAGAEWDDGRRSTLVSVVGAAPGAEETLAVALGEALVFSGIEAGSFDVVFLDPTSPAAEAARRVGIVFSLPEDDIAATAGQAPDPGPPRLR
jgi:hypothetical protein